MGASSAQKESNKIMREQLEMQRQQIADMEKKRTQQKKAKKDTKVRDQALRSQRKKRSQKTGFSAGDVGGTSGTTPASIMAGGKTLIGS